MAIQFPCASCQQPIEVDDAWADKAVACPYCRKVVTAPAQSSWPPGNIPVATPARGAFAPPPPPGETVAPGRSELPTYPVASAPVRHRGQSAAWALMLAVASAVLSIIAFIIWSAMAYERAVQRVGTGASNAQIQEAFNQLVLEHGLPIHPAAAVSMFVGAFCAVCGLVLAIRSFARRERRPVLAGIACALSVLFLACQGLLMLMMVGTRLAHTATMPG